MREHRRDGLGPAKIGCTHFLVVDIGLVNGVNVAILKIPPFIATQASSGCTQSFSERTRMQMPKLEMRALAVSGEKRHPDYPDIPTVKESGYPAHGLSGFHS